MTLEDKIKAGKFERANVERIVRKLEVAIAKIEAVADTYRTGFARDSYISSTPIVKFNDDLDTGRAILRKMTELGY